LVRQREVRNLGIPNIFTHGGLPLTVMIDFEMRLNPQGMGKDELYYDDFEREDQMVRILKRVLLESIANAPRPQEQRNTGRVDVASLFSPFLTGAAQIRDGLEHQALPRLAQHGIVISEGSLLISWLKIPDDIVTAYTDALAKGFSSSAEHELIQRLRNAGTGMSDMGLVHLINAIRDNPPELSTIFASGGFQPEVRIQSGAATVQTPMASTVQTQQAPPAAAPSPPSIGGMGANGAANADAAELPLTPEDMVLLRSLD
jgi:hypothetical protein